MSYVCSCIVLENAKLNKFFDCLVESVVAEESDLDGDVEDGQFA